MVDWFVIGVLAVIIIILLKAKRMQHKTFIILILIIALFFYTTVYSVIKENSINIRSFDGIATVGKIYFNWFIHIGKNVGNIAGYSIKMDWEGNATKNVTTSNISKIGK